MWFRRAFLALSLFLFFLFFGEGICLTTLGALTKVYFRYFKKVELEFEAVRFKHMGLTFYDLSLTEEGVFSFYSPKTALSFHAKHIEVERPEVNLFQIPSFSENQDSRWTIAMRDGKLRAAGFSDVDFSFQKPMLEGPSVLELSSGPSKIITHIASKESSHEIDFHLMNVQLSFFKAWLGGDTKGDLNGSFHVKKSGDELLCNRGYVDFEDLSFSGRVKSLLGHLDWEGPLSLKGNALDWEPMYNSGRLRLSIKEGSLHSPFEKHPEFDLKGSFSFDGKSGTKWESTLASGPDIISSSGRGFFKSVSQKWVEVSLKAPRSEASLEGSEFEDQYNWITSIQKLEAEDAILIQSALAALGLDTTKAKLQNGTLKGVFSFEWLDRTFQNPKLIEGSLHNFSGKWDETSFSANSIEFQNEAYTFEALSYQKPGGIFLENWSGSGNLKDQIAFLSGSIEGLQTSLELKGDYTDFCMHGKCTGVLQGDLSLKGAYRDQALIFDLLDADVDLFSALHLSAVTMQGQITTSQISLSEIRGLLAIGKEVPFYCPILESNGAFDLRLEEDLFDLARLYGHFEGNGISFDETRCHFFNQPIQVSSFLFGQSGISEVTCSCTLPVRALPYFFEVPREMVHKGDQGMLNLAFIFNPEKGTSCSLDGNIYALDQKVDLSCNFEKKGPEFLLQNSQIAGASVTGAFRFERGGVSLNEARVQFNETVDLSLSGSFTSFESWKLKLSHLFVELETLSPLFHFPLTGVLEGEGLVQYEKGLEADFDILSKKVELFDHVFENKGPLNVYLSSEKGAFVRGLSPTLFDRGEDSSLVDLKVGLLQYNFREDELHLMQTEMHLFPSLFRKEVILSRFPFIEEWISEESLHMNAEIIAKRDLSKVSCQVKRGSIPLKTDLYHIKDAKIDVDQTASHFQFDLDVKNTPLAVELALFMDPEVKGKLTLDHGLRIDWKYKDGLHIQSIEGKGLGLDANFRFDEDSLIGIAHINCHELKPYVPEGVSEMFRVLEMGSGYELMGRLFAERESPSFSGLVRGKQIELFGFQLKNLLGKIELSENRVHLSDVKISDFAATLKVDELLAKGDDLSPWTLQIPSLNVTDLRPSLLQDVSGKPVELSPLLIKKMSLKNIHGYLEDSSTFTADGSLDFINSYKREKTIFDIPSDMLSRIVGFDLDLLVPVCGSLNYELKNGLFRLTELSDSFSENKRSQFFLLHDDKSPTMDLDGNLNILIKMKHFVLFTFTDPFIISVDGKLNSPRFRLQSKKRFLGVL